MLLRAAEEVEKKQTAQSQPAPHKAATPVPKRAEELSDVKVSARGRGEIDDPESEQNRPWLGTSEARARLVERSRNVTDCLLKGVRLCESK